MEKQKIFFSYSRADGSEFALRLAVDLKQKGFDVWIDQEDIRAGSEWDIEIEKALETCDCLLFIETEKSVVSNNVLDEVYYALEQNKKVIPVILIDSKTPFRLKRLQHIDFTKNYNNGLALLLTELETKATTNSYLPEPEHVEHESKKAATVNYKTLIIIAAAIIIVAALFYLIKDNKNNTVTPAWEIAIKDTSSNDIDETNSERNQLPTPNIDTGLATKKIDLSNANKRKAAPAKDKPANTKTGIIKSQAKPAITSPAEETNTANRIELYAGDWRLFSVEPKARSQQGYLKIEALDETKVSIKSYMQFYYPETRATSYLTIFNAFANCKSCVLKPDVKLVTEDVAVGSRTIQTLKEDQPDGRKAGEVILDANSNKSIRASISLHFTDAFNATIKVQQPETITLAHALPLEPFVYTFRFKKRD